MRISPFIWIFKSLPNNWKIIIGHSLRVYSFFGGDDMSIILITFDTVATLNQSHALITGLV